MRAGAFPPYEPMLATKWREPFSDPRWSFEIKWDGVRALVATNGKTVEVRSRRGRLISATYPELEAFRDATPGVYDGEIVTLDPSGKPSFERLQSRMNIQNAVVAPDVMSRIPISYVVFDLLHDATHPLVDMPYEVRRERLGAIEVPSPAAIGTAVERDGVAMWDFIQGRGLEGMVAKKHGSVYRPGQRTDDWRKIGLVDSVRAVVAGYLPGGGGRSDSFGSLLLGLWTREGLRWIGSVGTGFNDGSLRAIREALDEMTIDRSTFIPEPDLPRQAVFVDPVLVAAVEYKEWTSVGRLRAPVFKGFTGDDLGDITWELEGPAADEAG